MDKKILGKGLDTLIPKKSFVQNLNKEFSHLPLSKIIPGRYQPRLEIDSRELEELSRSIKEKGFIQPIVVRSISPEIYEVVAGERRYQAAKLLALKEIPVMIKELDDKDALIFAIVENLQRKDLNPIEEALALKRLMEEFEFTLEAAAKFVAKDKTTVSNSLRLLKLPREIREALQKGLISRSQARTILGAQSEEEQKRIFTEILKGGLTVRDIEKKVKSVSRKKHSADPFVDEAESKLQRALGTKVKIFNKRNNCGKIVVEYFNLQDLERIIRKIS